MVKHILAVSIIQSIVVFGIVFAGEWFIPEAPGYIPNQNGMIFPGRPYTLYGDPLWERYASDYGYSRHMTIVFTAFVMMQVFNMINARKIHDELNICEGITKNCMFVVIWIIIFVVQILLSQFTQDLFKCARAVSSH
jgi:magnesium-transporting ATPase (P-type)